MAGEGGSRPQLARLAPAPASFVRRAAKFTRHARCARSTVVPRTLRAAGQVRQLPVAPWVKHQQRHHQRTRLQRLLQPGVVVQAEVVLVPDHPGIGGWRGGSVTGGGGGWRRQEPRHLRMPPGEGRFACCWAAAAGTAGLAACGLRLWLRLAVQLSMPQPQVLEHGSPAVCLAPALWRRALGSGLRASTCSRGPGPYCLVSLEGAAAGSSCSVNGRLSSSSARLLVLVVTTEGHACGHRLEEGRVRHLLDEPFNGV